MVLGVDKAGRFEATFNLGSASGLQPFIHISLRESGTMGTLFSPKCIHKL